MALDNFSINYSLHCRTTTLSIISMLNVRHMSETSYSRQKTLRHGIINITTTRITDSQRHSFVITIFTTFVQPKPQEITRTSGVTKAQTFKVSEVLATSKGF